MTNVKLSAPWDIYFSKLNALFSKDKEISLNFDRDTYTITITSTNDDKADALSQIVPKTVEMGNITLTINVVAEVPNSPADLYDRAFKGNPIFAKTEACALPTGEKVYFAEFYDRAAHFFADDLTNPEGLQFYLYQDIAKEVLNSDNINITSTSTFYGY